MTKEQEYADAMRRYWSHGYGRVGPVVSVLVVALQIVTVARVPWGELGPLAFVCCLAAAYLLADFVNGLVHMAMDNTDSYRSVVGPLIAAFHLHHKTPRYLDSSPAAVYVLESGSKLWLVGYLVALVVAQGELAPAASLTLALVGVLSSVAEVSHYLCHNGGGPLVRGLQRCRLLLPPAHHAAHHTRDNTHYAFLNGLTDPLLNAIARRTCRGYVGRTDLHVRSYQGLGAGNRHTERLGPLPVPRA